MAQRAAPYTASNSGPASHTFPVIHEIGCVVVVAKLYSQFAIVQKYCLLGLAAEKEEP
jgi:hypothetical protein